jgi:hypothetical protein
MAVLGALAPESLARRHLDTIRSVLGSDRAVATLLSVSASQVSRWRRGQVPDIDNADRLGGLALVVEMLARWLHPDVIEGWLNGANQHLDGATPASMIRRSRVADVIGAIEDERGGVFG